MGQGTEEQLSGDIASTREDLSRNVDELVDKVSPGRVVQRRKQAVRGRLHQMRNSVMGSADAATTTMGDAGSMVGDRASGAAEAVTGGTSQAAHAVRSRTQGSPLAAGLIAFGAGALISALLPSSERETQVAQRAVETARDKGQPLAEEAKSVGQQMGEQLKTSAQEAVQQVKETAQDSAERVKDEGQSSVQSVKDDTQTKMP